MSQDFKRGVKKDLKAAAIIVRIKPELRAMDVRQKAFLSNCDLWLKFFDIQEVRKDYGSGSWEIEILLHRH